jgi:peroxiredoxin family protein
VLGGGHHHFTRPVEIHATRFTQASIRAIEQAGGRAVAVFHTAEAIRCFKNPERFWRKQPEKAMEQLDAPTRLRERLFYSQPKGRGYMAPEIMSTLTSEFKQKYKLL